MSGRERRRRYNDLAAKWDLSGLVQSFLEEWSSGPDAVDLIGPEVDDLDALFLMKLWTEQVTFALSMQIAACLEEGRSWAEIAAALRVSRQAAVKRFDR